MLFVITPGVDWAYAISAGTRHRAAVVPAVTGMLAGHLTATVVVAAGTQSHKASHMQPQISRLSNSLHKAFLAHVAVGW